MIMEDQRLQQFKTIVTYSAFGLGTATGLFFLGRYFVNRIRTNSIGRHSLDEGDPATYARQLKLAFDNDNYFGWGTSVPMVLQVFNQLPSKAAYNKVQRAFQGLYNKSLTGELESELSSEEYNQVIRILSTKQ